MSAGTDLLERLKPSLIDIRGRLAADASMAKLTWFQVGGPADVLFEFDLAGREAAMTRELLRVATAIASFTGLYFAISMLTDDLYRKEFLSRITDEMKQTFVRRAEYLKLLGKGESPGA